MSDKGHMEHDPNCREPLNEHSGNEPCIRWVEDVEEIIPIRRYKAGPQGNQVIDYSAEWEDTKRLHGSVDTPGRMMGHSEIQDRRDNRDPEQVGREILAARNGGEAHAA